MMRRHTLLTRVLTLAMVFATVASSALSVLSRPVIEEFGISRSELPSGGWLWWTRWDRAGWEAPRAWSTSGRAWASPSARPPSGGCGRLRLLRVGLVTLVLGAAWVATLAWRRSVRMRAALATLGDRT